MSAGSPSPASPASHPDALRRAVEVMDLLRSPGGCPWDAAQTHDSLTRYLLEETYEVLEAIETGDVTLLREELGDLLLQVLFHARLAEELPPGEAFGIDEVAAGLVDKLVARHPQVFGGAEAAEVADVAEQSELWERLKIAEKGRTSAVDGVPLAQPALSLAAKLVSRASRGGLAELQSAASGDFAPRVASSQPPLDTGTRHSAGSAADDIGARLFELVREAVAADVDPESALRRTALAFRDAIRAAEAAD